MKKFINRDLQVLFENRMVDNGRTLTGLSENYLRVNASGDNSMRGNIIRVRPQGLKNSALIAEITQD